MTDNFDEFEGHEHEQAGDEAVTPRVGVASNLAHAWRARPLFKLLVLMTAVGAVVAASVSLFSGHDSADHSHIAAPPNLNIAPGGPVSPYMKQQTDLANEQRSKAALEKGGSSMPTPIGQATDVGDLMDNKGKNDALNELRAEVEMLQKQQVQQQQVQQKVQAPVQPQRAPEQFDDSLGQAMQHQMSLMMEGWKPQGVKQVTVTKTDAASLAAANGTGSGTDSNAATAAAAAALNNPTTALKTIVPAGTVSYAQLLVEANSDVPSPILAQIVSGPLSGARAIGAFQVANGYNDYLVLQFNLADRKGVQYRINAVALDPDTTLGGMATEVDQRYFSRVVLPAAAGFLQGLGSAMGQGNTTTTTTGDFAVVQQGKEGLQQGVFQGLGQAAQTAAQFFQQQANVTHPLVRVAAGTPMGLFFVSAVYDPATIPTAPTLTTTTQTSYGASIMPYSAGGGGAGSPYGASPYGASPYGAAGASPYGAAGASPYGAGGVNPYAAAGGYPGGAAGANGAAGQGSNSGYSVPYPNYATQNTSTMGNGVSFLGANGMSPIR